MAIKWNKFHFLPIHIPLFFFECNYKLAPVIDEINRELVNFPSRKPANEYDPYNFVVENKIQVSPIF